MPKAKIIFTLVAIILIAGLDYQFFSEGMGKIIAPVARQAGHIIVLIPIAVIGNLALRKLPFPFIAELWRYSYLIVISMLLVIGGLHWKFALFSESFLDQVRMVRLIFCSPLPLLFLLLMHWLIRTGKLTG